MIVDNRSGASGIIGTELVAKAPPDGYTLLLLTGGIASSIPQYKEFPLDMKSLVPISSMGYFDCLMVVNAKSDFQNLGDLVYFNFGHGISWRSLFGQFWLGGAERR